MMADDEYADFGREVLEGLQAGGIGGLGQLRGRSERRRRRSAEYERPVTKKLAGAPGVEPR